ncbi:hypothetical protein SPSIL_010570 [Sporomusa silvacetica DSM 10669]|uniref:Uncharacterized protein n=1 Tax=Sporomusa silvacetica DSM 10669 TaxID=1123289 RepID=A0ABZ3IHV8_9FIRM|nr:hypothetical protein [Sporomusa silvacetica]OZC21429.1 hypothetical protein SPSIL_10340 [Sporomusa silvacetica DSM 10669]
MKKEWIVPEIAEFSVAMTAEQGKLGGGGDSLLPEQLTPWHDCVCCS